MCVIFGRTHKRMTLFQIFNFNLNLFIELLLLCKKNLIFNLLI